VNEVAILIVAYNGREDLGACLDSIRKSADGPVTRRIVVVDNASADGTVEYLRAEFPEVACVAAAENLGFAGGNNLGWEYIQEHWPQADYVCLLNQDTVVADGWLRPLVQYLEQHPAVGCVQPKLCLYPETNRINTTGNRSHYLGFGFMTHYGELDQGQFEQPASIQHASGAALMVRTALLRRLGLFESFLFMYLEDTELGWKLRQVGAEIMLVPQSRVYHKYQFKSSHRYYYYLERNRWWLLLVYYRLATLLLLMPALLLMEAGQLAFASWHGCLRDKLRSYAFFLVPRNLRLLWTRRRQVQSRRLISDRQFLSPSLGAIDFPELDNVLIRWVANPLLGAYWSVAKRLIFW
jgi:GT2 family glycosyltransferase